MVKRRSFSVPLRCIAIATLLFAAAWRAAAEPLDVAAEIAGLLHGPWGADSAEIAGVKRFYAALDRHPAWSGRERALDQALALAWSHGLDPADYAVELEEASLALPGDTSAAARRDLAMSATALRFVADLHSGRLVPRDLGRSWGIETPAFDAAMALAEAMRSGELPQWAAALAPPHAAYARLMEALQRHRTIAERGGWTTVDSAGGTIDPGDPRMPALRQRLALGGDLAPEAVSDADVAAGLRRFQARHGLVPDGRAGSKTLAALNVPVEERIAQIVANLERWRRLPRQFPAYHVAVNAADQTVELVEDGATVLRLRTVVGDPKHQTPEAQARITAVTFNPPWNIPTSIARKEILPKLRRNPTYLRDNDMVVRNGLPEDPHGLGIDWRAFGGRFPYLLQQRPGAKNALGVTKLEMPNRFDVYLHDTPSKTLFARPERYFSHGCIRVQDVRALADRLLAATGATIPAAAQAAAERGDTVSIPLPRPVPVFLLYLTAFVDPDGTVHFRRDAYGRDARIVAALAARGAKPTSRLVPVAQQPRRTAGL